MGWKRLNLDQVHKSKVLRVAITGLTGRMGISIAHELSKMSNAALCAAIVGREDTKNIAEFNKIRTIKILPCNTLYNNDEKLPLHDIDVIIDFSAPDLSVICAQHAAEYGIPLVIGTTGFTPEHKEILRKVYEKIAVVISGNMSVGVSLLMSMVKMIAKVLPNDFDVEIREMHHRHKVDAPSGTALMLAEHICENRGTDDNISNSDNKICYGRTGARQRGEIGISSLRGGEITGDHEVHFLGEDEHIICRHVANNRNIFARGAIRAAHWVVSQPPGKYSMSNVLDDYHHKGSQK